MSCTKRCCTCGFLLALAILGTLASLALHGYNLIKMWWIGIDAASGTSGSVWLLMLLWIIRYVGTGAMATLCTVGIRKSYVRLSRPSSRVYAESATDQINNTTMHMGISNTSQDNRGVNIYATNQLQHPMQSSHTRTLPGHQIPNDQMQSNPIPGQQMQNNQMQGNPIPGYQIQNNPMQGNTMPGGLMPNNQMRSSVMSGHQMQKNPMSGHQMQNNQMQSSPMEGYHMPNEQMQSDPMQENPMPVNQSQCYQQINVPQENIQQPSTCVLCTEGLAVTILPCGHTIICLKCSDFLTRNRKPCPKCDTPIQSVIKPYVY